jgi:hypothetical protein
VGRGAALERGARAAVVGPPGELDVRGVGDINHETQEVPFPFGGGDTRDELIFQRERGVAAGFLEFRHQSCVRGVVTVPPTFVASATAAAEADGALEMLAAGFGVFLDWVLEPEVQRILLTDGPAVLGLARFVELDERYALEPSVQALEAANASGLLRVEDPQMLARLLFGAMTRAGLLIASAPDPKATRDAVGVTFRQMMSGFLKQSS